VKLEKRYRVISQVEIVRDFKSVHLPRTVGGS